MNLFKLYFDLVALQYSLSTKYMQGFIEGMDKVNRDFTDEANR